MTATRPRIPTAACYREVTATRLAGLFTQSLRWWDYRDKPRKTIRCVMNSPGKRRLRKTLKIGEVAV